jgi:hypothetical protein
VAVPVQEYGPAFPERKVRVELQQRLFEEAGGLR